VRFSRPVEFVAELRARGPTPEPLVRLTVRTRRGRYRNGTPLPFQELLMHASYLRQIGGIMYLVTLEYGVGTWWGDPRAGRRDPAGHR
jgi:hypothetical protein